MTSRRWSWAAAKVTGTSHIRTGKGCDDAGACVVLNQNGLEVLAIVVSDGAGSAEHSAIGSRLTIMRFVRCVSTFLSTGGEVTSLTSQNVLAWLDDIRDRISVAAEALQSAPRDFAATLVACLITPTHAAFIHVGDGAAVFRLDQSEEWQIGSWPNHGEYASTTYFVTDDPEPNVVVSHMEGSVREVCVFSDGIERLVLEFSSRSAFAPFFNKVFGAFESDVAGRNRKMSAQLKFLLESPSVCEKTDDDKTVVLAKRA